MIDMLKELRRNIFGGEFFGRVTGFEVSGEQTKYTVREPDVTNRYIWLRGTPAKQLESNGDYIDAGD